jgi:hypothetical protein
MGGEGIGISRGGGRGVNWVKVLNARKGGGGGGGGRWTDVLVVEFT